MALSHTMPLPSQLLAALAMLIGDGDHEHAIGSILSFMIPFLAPSNNTTNAKVCVRTAYGHNGEEKPAVVWQ